MRKLVLASALAAFALSAQAAPPPEAASCAACHGPEGKAQNPEWPNLAGQNKAYLVLQMKAFRDGGRVNPLMSPMAKTLSDEAIETIATYYSGL